MMMQHDLSYSRREYLKYLHLLRRHLEAKYGSPCQAFKEFGQIMSKLDEVRQMNVERIQVLQLIDAKEVTPLLIAIYHNLRSLA